MTVTLPETLQSWSDAVSGGNVDTITDHYAQSGVLKGTVWAGFVSKQADSQGRVIKDYFVHLLSGKKDVRVQWDSVTEITTGTFAVDYTFLWDDEATGEAKSLPADATYVITDGKIQLHHSSPK